MTCRLNRSFNTVNFQNIMSEVTQQSVSRLHCQKWTHTHTYIHTDIHTYIPYRFCKCHTCHANGAWGAESATRATQRTPEVLKEPPWPVMQIVKVPRLPRKVSQRCWKCHACQPATQMEPEVLKVWGLPRQQPPSIRPRCSPSFPWPLYK